MKPLDFKCMLRPHLAMNTSPCRWGPGMESGLGHSLGFDPAPAPHLTGGRSECWTVGDLPVPGEEPWEEAQGIVHSHLEPAGRPGAGH